MNRKTICALIALLIAGCTAKEPGSSKELPSHAPVAAPTPAAKPVELPPLISQDEADAKAAAAIKKENADAELAKLKKELSGG